jgi:hypothetical protein
VTSCPQIIAGIITLCPACEAVRAAKTGSRSSHCIGDAKPRYPYGSNEHGPSLVSIFGTPATESSK